MSSNPEHRLLIRINILKNHPPKSIFENWFWNQYFKNFPYCWTIKINKKINIKVPKKLYRINMFFLFLIQNHVFSTFSTPHSAKPYSSLWSKWQIWPIPFPRQEAFSKATLYMPFPRLSRELSFPRQGACFFQGWPGDCLFQGCAFSKTDQGIAFCKAMPPFPRLAFSKACLFQGIFPKGLLLHQPFTSNAMTHANGKRVATIPQIQLGLPFSWAACRAKRNRLLPQFPNWSPPQMVTR